MTEHIQERVGRAAKELVVALNPIYLTPRHKKSALMLFAAVLERWYREGKADGIKEAGKEYLEAMKLGETTQQ